LRRQLQHGLWRRPGGAGEVHRSGEGDGVAASEAARSGDSRAFLAVSGYELRVAKRERVGGLGKAGGVGAFEPGAGIGGPIEALQQQQALVERKKMVFRVRGQGLVQAGKGAFDL